MQRDRRDPHRRDWRFILGAPRHETGRLENWQKYDAWMVFNGDRDARFSWLGNDAQRKPIAALYLAFARNAKMVARIVYHPFEAGGLEFVDRLHAAVAACLWQNEIPSKGFWDNMLLGQRHLCRCLSAAVYAFANSCIRMANIRNGYGGVRAGGQACISNKFPKARFMAAGPPALP